MIEIEKLDNQLIIGICDDEPEVFDHVSLEMKKYAEKESLKYTLLPRFSPQELLRYCESGKPKPDLMIMDIEMPEISGIKLSQKINSICPDCQIAYHTNYLEYAVDVYETEHCYYILKNQLRERLPQLLDKVVNNRGIKHQQIVLEQQGQKAVVVLNQIVYAERIGKVTKVHMEDGGIIRTSLKLQELLAAISVPGFVRCHNSFVVSLFWVHLYKRQEFIMKNGVQIPISRRYADDVKENFARWSGGLI